MNKKSLWNLFQKNKTAGWLLLLCLAGMILFAVGSTTEKRGTQTSEHSAWDFHELQLQTAKELEELIKQVEGVKNAKVYVTFEKIQEYEYAENRESREGYQSSDYVILDSSEESGLLLSSACPMVRGVAVVCEFSGGSTNKEDITLLLSAALGISTNKIHVSNMTP